MDGDNLAPTAAPANIVPEMNRLARFGAWFAGLFLLLIGAVIYREFLFGGAVLLYTDVGSDSVNSYYPDFVHLSEYIRSHGFPSWSFGVGMGQDLAYAASYLVWQPVSWLPKALIAHALVYQHVGKILIAGLFFFRFLELRGLQWPASLLGSLLLSFSAYMCIGSCWYPLADEVVCFAGILLGTEEAVRHGRWLLLASLVALVGMITPFHLYLCAFLLVTYVPIRLFGQYGWQPRIVLRTCLPLAAVASLGVGLGAILTLPYLRAILQSPRGSGTTSAVDALRSFPIFGLESPLNYITAAFKPFANDILGAGDAFRGWENYLEAPLTYCGLVCLILLPQILAGGVRRHRIIFVLFLAGMLVPTVFPWFRHLFWLFQGNYYRTYSLFCVLGTITLSMLAFSRYIAGRPLRLWLLAATTAVLVGVLYLPFEQAQTLIDPNLRSAVTILLILYGLLLTAGQLSKRQGLAAWLVLGLSVIELVQFDQITVSQRATVKKEDLQARVAYNDETVDVVRDIRSSDHEKFFRITKLRSSSPSAWPGLNDAMIFGYYGTPSYSSFNNGNYTDFLTAVGIIPPGSETDTRWSMGLLNSPILALFAAEKYALVHNPLLSQTSPQYQFVRPYSQDYLFQNQFFLPLGLTFGHYLAEDIFRQLSDSQKAAVLLGVVVLPANSGEAHGILPKTMVDLEEEMKVTSLADVIAIRRKAALQLTSFSPSQMGGTVRLDRKSILVLQTPFDSGWRALQDGQPAPVLKADIGLLGVALDSGEHTVELHYRNPVLIPALIVTLASFLALAWSLWRWPRLSLPA